MPQKKKSKQKKRVVRAPKESEPKELDKGFFARHSDVLPPEPKERTRVKTFIVEKPIIIHEKPQHITVDSEPRGLARIFNSKKSRYAKKKPLSEYEEAPVSEEEPMVDDGESNPDELGEEPLEGEEDLGGEPVEGEDGLTDESVDGGEEDLGDEPGGDIGDEEFVKKKHARSRGMFVNVWWKKAIMWAVLIWVVVLGFELLLQAGKFVEVDLTRQWWFLLAGLIVICMIYFKFIDGKLSL